jgi:hypothetical protein
MITYEVDAGLPNVENVGSDELYRVEFRAPTVGADGQVYDDVLVWIDNRTRADAERMRRCIEQTPDGYLVFCRHCPAGLLPSQQEHDGHRREPEEIGWAHREISHFRLMPMREAV